MALVQYRFRISVLVDMDGVLEFLEEIEKDTSITLFSEGYDFREFLESDILGGNVYVAEIEDKIVGIMILSNIPRGKFLEEKFSKYYYLYFLGVHTNLRRRGLGFNLLLYGMTATFRNTRRNRKIIFINTVRNVAMLKLCKRAGATLIEDFLEDNILRKLCIMDPNRVLETIVLRR